jgi:hypothetical protein
VQRTTDLTGDRDSGDLIRGACTTLEDPPVRVSDTALMGDLDPFFVFKVLVVFEKVFDLLDRYFGKV